MTQKISKTMSLLRRFEPILPRLSLLNMYKTFIRSDVDIIYEQAHEKLEFLQYNACVAIKGVLRETSLESLHHIYPI